MQGEAIFSNGILAEVEDLFFVNSVSTIPVEIGADSDELGNEESLLLGISLYWRRQITMFVETQGEQYRLTIDQRYSV